MFGSTGIQTTPSFNTNSTNSANGTSLFGNKPATGGLFGGNNNSTPAQTQPNPGLFGNSNQQNSIQNPQQNAAQNQSSLFGSSLSSNSNNFTNTNTNPNAFGSSNAFNTSISSGNLGNNGSNFVNNSSLVANNNHGLYNSIFSSAAPSRATPANNVTEHLMKIKEAWDPSSPNCAFQYYFYNKVPANEAMLYVKPPNQDQQKWDQAMNERPDSTSVPVQAVGFSDLQKRMASQEQQVGTYRARIHELNDKLEELTTRHDLKTTVKITEMKAKHVELAHKTLKLAVKAQVLRNRGLVLRTDEESLKEKLEQLSSAIEDPAIYGRINEIWARMTALREMARVMNSRNEEQRLDEYPLGWDRDDEQLEKLTKILKDQQTGIAYLSKILKGDQEEMAKLLSALEKEKK